MADNDLTDRQLELLAASRQKDDPVVVEAEEAKQVDQAQNLLTKADGVSDPAVVEAGAAERLEEADNLLDQAADVDDPTVVSETEYDAMQEDVEAVEEVLAGALQESRGLRDATVDAMSLGAMISEFKDDDGEFELEALSQHPETGGTGGSGSGTDNGSGNGGGSGSGDGFDPADVDLENRQEAKDRLRRASLMENRTPEHAEALRNEAADLLGVDDADDVDVEVL